MVVVQREAEAHAADRLVAWPYKVHAAVGELVRAHLLRAGSGVHHRDEQAVAKCSRCVTRDARGQRERVRACGADDRLDHPATLTTGSDSPQGYALAMSSDEMRATWDAAASSEAIDTYVGDPATAEPELDGFFGRLGDDPRGGTCVEVGCGPGRMTGLLAARFDRVIAVDVSTEMLALARAAVHDGNVDFRAVGGERLDSVGDDEADVLVCYLVLQHLPDRRLVSAYLAEFGRVLRPAGRAFVQLPVTHTGVAPFLWRGLRRAAVPLTARGGGVSEQAAYRGVRLTDVELADALLAANLEVAARDESDTSPYRYAREVFLRLEHA